MQQLFLRILLLGALLGGAAPTVSAQAPPLPTLLVTGAGLTPVSFTAAELAKAPRVTVEAKDKAGKPHRYEGVALHYLLTTAGVKLDRHGDALTKVVTAAAADGYQAVLAIGEAMPEIAPQTVLVADHCDGEVLSAGSGPWQLIVPGDLKPTRWVRQLERLTVTTVAEKREKKP